MAEKTPLLQQGMPPPQQGLPPMTQAPAVVVVANTFSESPVSMTCPYCHTHIVTQTSYVAGTLTFLAAGGMFLFGMVCCFCVPFFLDGMKDICHSCSSCGRVIAVHRRI